MLKEGFIVLVLLSAHREGVSVSCMQNFSREMSLFMVEVESNFFIDILALVECYYSLVLGECNFSSEQWKWKWNAIFLLEISVLVDILVLVECNF